MNYTEYGTYMRQLMVIQAPNTDYNTIEPLMIEDAQLRIQRDLNLLATVVRSSATSTTPSSRDMTIPSGLVVIDQVNIISPAATAPDSGTRNPATRVAPDWLDFVYPRLATPGLPRYWAQLNTTTILLGPWPDAAYRVEFVGTQRIALLSAGAPNNFISDNMADLLVAASMIFATGYQQNYGSQADDPKSAVSWTQVYKDKLASTDAEEMRRRFMAGG